jgi:hypothetical protein
LLPTSKPTTDTIRSNCKHLCKLFAGYAAIFAVFFWGVHSGVGQFWDWSFPYFSDQLDMLFANKSSSWTSANMGTPLGYASDYFLRFAISMFSFLPTEVVRYGLLVAVFAAGALAMYLLARRHTTNWLAFLLGLAAFINPAMFYKYTAGHFNYMVSLTLFLFFIYFLFYKFQKNARSAVIIGLFFGLLGFQIQFFVIAGIFLLVYFLFNRKLLSFKYLLIMLAIPLLLNLVWLSNFVSGAANVAETGAQAAKVTFKAMSGTDFLSVFTFSFSKATLLSKFYVFYELLWNAMLFVFLLWLLVKEKKKETFDVVLLVFLSVMIFMATGLYQAINLGPITVLYPMLREVGHFAPVIVVIALILIARLVQGRTSRWALTLVLAGSLLIVGVKFQYFSQSYSFADAREQFAPFKKVADSDSSDYRILAYPFFDQYSFKDLPKDPPGTLPLKNSGHDSFAAFSQQEYIANTVAPYKFEDSIQYRLLQTYNLDVLRPYNVKYIFDFSDFYESNYERYVPPTVYNNDLSLIKNDKQFFDKLIAANPGKLRRVNEKVLEIRDVKPRISSDASLFALSRTDQADQASIFSKQALEESLDYVSDNEALVPYTTKITPLLSEPADMKSDYQSGTFTQTMHSRGKDATALYVDRLHETLYYEASSSQLTIYSQSTGQLSLNGQPLYDSNDERRVLGEYPLPKGASYYVSFKGRVVQVKPGSTQRIGVGTQGDKIDLLTSEGSNLVSNGSFEQGLWQKEVKDCNNYDYDTSAKLGMDQTDATASEGSKSLELRAEWHDACTYTNVNLEEDSDYLLSYDYQSPNSRTASFFMGYDGKKAGFAKASQTIRSQNWNNYNSLITTDDKGGKALLYLYALQQGEQETINHYDNVSLVKLAPVQSIEIPGLLNQYEKIDLPSGGDHSFTVSDTGQSFENLILNPSFEDGTWQKKVSDCRNYDNKSDIAMGLNQNDKTHGKQSLELTATRHDACIRTTTNITAGTEYQLSFDYKGKKGKSYAYAVSYDDPENTLRRQQLTVKSDGWQHANLRITAPARATTATLYLYAIESGDKTTNSLLYDNVSLVELPDFTDRFYVVEEPKEKLFAPGSITFENESQSRKSIKVTGAETPFFVNMSETFHKQWLLELDNKQVSGLVNRWKPGTAGTTVDEHYKMNNYSNLWLVDPQKLCNDNGNLRQGCTKRADGSYDIALVAEFKPQRWFTVSAFISWVTIIGSVVFIVASRGRELPTYQFLRNKNWRKAMRKKQQ